MDARIGRAAVIVAALALAVVMHLPLMQGGVLPGEGTSDILRGWWSVWLVGTEMPGWPFSTAYAGFPNGADIVPFPAVSLVTFSGVASVLGAETAVCFMVIAHTMFAVIATCWFVRTLGGGWGTGILAGAVVATQPVLSGALRDGTLEVLAVGWVPLTLGCMLRACRGQLHYGLLAGLVFVAMCVESVYYASFTTAGVVATLTMIRTRRGVLGAALAALVVAIGAGILALLFWPVLEGIDRAVSIASSADVRAQNATDWTMLRYFAINPGAMGWGTGVVWGPPLNHVVILAAGGLLAIRRTPYLTVLGIFFLLLSMHHDAVLWWADSPLGSPVRFPRRYLAAMAAVLAPGLWWASLPLRRWPKIELAAGLGLGTWFGWWGIVAGGLWQAYPTMEVPAITFAEVVKEDSEDAAILFLPLWVPGAGGLRSDLPVFASLGDDLSSGDLLALQALTNKRAWTAPKLVTLQARGGEQGLMATNLTDLALASAGQSIPQSAMLDSESYHGEVRWLMGLGLKYVAVDLARYNEAEQGRIDEVFAPFAVNRKDYSDGTGVRLYTLYEERPEPSFPPIRAQGREHFAGMVVPWRDLPGKLKRLYVHSDRGTRPCSMKWKTGDFDCGEVGVVLGVKVEIDGEVLEVTRQGGFSDHLITVVQ